MTSQDQTMQLRAAVSNFERHLHRIVCDCSEDVTLTQEDVTNIIAQELESHADLYKSAYPYLDCSNGFRSCAKFRALVGKYVASWRVHRRAVASQIANREVALSKVVSRSRQAWQAWRDELRLTMIRAHLMCVTEFRETGGKMYYHPRRR